jgi:hypothetical protein
MRSLFAALESPARDADLFDKVIVEDTRLRCVALGSAEPAEYRIELIDGQLWVSLSTEDRWLSGSIEAELMNSGDDLCEIIEEELVDQGCQNPRVTFEHFRDPEMRYTFRSRIGVDPAGDPGPVAAEAIRWLLGYEAAFRDLGDMSAPEED